VKNSASTKAAVGLRGHTIDQEIEMYLNSIETSTSLLLQYPNVVKAFLKYNAACLTMWCNCRTDVKLCWTNFGTSSV